MLSMIANSEQPLTTRYSRRLITMQKRHPYSKELEQGATVADQTAL